jgi:hypothetical protein
MERQRRDAFGDVGAGLAKGATGNGEPGTFAGSQTRGMSPGNGQNRSMLPVLNASAASSPWPTNSS